MMYIKINEVRYSVDNFTLSGKELRNLCELDDNWVVCMKRGGAVIEIPDNAIAEVRAGESLFTRVKGM